MKKCPKCGTVLDDSKKKCYMCGADLTTSNSVKDFSSNFDSSIGSTISGGSDNIFNNGKDIDVDSKDIVDEANKGSFFSHSSASKDYFHSEISKLNDMNAKDEPEKKKKGGLFGRKNKKEEKIDKQVKKITYSTNPKIPKEMEQSIIEKQLDEMKKIQEPQEENKKENVIKSTIVEERTEQERNDTVPDSFKNFNTFLEEDKNTGKNESIFNKKKDNISEDKIESAFSMFNNDTKKSTYSNKVSYYDKDSETIQSDFSKLKEPKKKNTTSFGEIFKNKVDLRRKDPKELKEIGRMIFNMSCLIIFIGIIVVVYYKFLKVETKEELSGLQFTVPSYFKLSSTKNDYRYYISNQLGNDCSVKVSYGPASNPDDVTERWFSTLKSTYEKDEGAVVTKSEMKINGNKWESQRIVYLPTDGTEKSSSDILPRYIYSLYIYNTSFYTVQYANIKEDNECDLQYNKFLNTLEFIEKNVR